MSSSIFRCLGLSRDSIRKAIKRFRGKRRSQVVLATIICATRSKTIAPDGGLLEVECAKCGGVDSFEHLLECMKMGPLPKANDEEGVVDFLVRLARAATEHAPLWPVAVESAEVEMEACELLLEGWDIGRDSERVFSASEEPFDALSFGQDPEVNGQ